MSLQEIYQEVLLAHNEHPNCFCSLNDANRQAEGKNPLCGDEITVYIRIKGDKVDTVTFTGQGCAICKASASIMTEALTGKTLEEAQKEAEAFIALLNDETLPIPDNLGEREALLGVRKFPARLKCATLAWHTFLKALSGQAQEEKLSATSCASGCC